MRRKMIGIAMLAAAPAAAQTAPIAKIDTGSLEGTRRGELIVFKGIPLRRTAGRRAPLAAARARRGMARHAQGRGVRRRLRPFTSRLGS